MSDKQCFIITPIGDEISDERRHADMVQSVAVEPALKYLGYTVHRADQSDDPTMINDHVFNMLVDAAICVCDLSFLNPNVFYELGVRHAIQKPVIHIAQEGTRIPFDNAGHRVTFFNRSDIHSLRRLHDALKEQVRYIESADYRLSNPFTQALGRVALADSGDSREQLMAELIQRVGLLEQRRSSTGQDVAAGIMGQGELATMSVSGLLERLRMSGLFTAESTGSDVLAASLSARSSAAAAQSVAASAESRAASAETKLEKLQARFDEKFGP